MRLRVSKGASLKARRPSPSSQVHGEEAQGAQLVHRFRHADVGAVGEEAAVEAHGGGFAGVVQLLAQAIADLFERLGGIEGSLPASQKTQEGAELGEVAFNRALHLGILQLHRQGSPVERRGAMNLA